ncbi:L-threonylcarbamoyladenylate synthase [Candidatus Xianfuyuplasma coldseepsis]|uniref:Threonylcarbamoyl-AMP synthase n=1 Tax=Candidatus Xianfuyuplasma coldseepsis TaxID=2782163 RepID=A0A7L7KRM3_9MOLU|nr:L-threonylcarbamoyladenylate synthase [Xianfuyuplasma coldseepsis]QMS85471.1 threonylcarbamoyl-AMP synthase [Xianfuyuplasma coldseepsis]
MKSRIYTVDDLQRQEVQRDIQTTFQRGGNVVFPTETVYGIGASALNQEGINGIYAIKGRPQDNPLIMHLVDTTSLEEYVDVDQPYINTLMERFWPGPLTMVFTKKEIVPHYFTGGLQTVGVRIPGSDVARKVIAIAGVPVCAPSANISGRPSATLFKHVLEDFQDKVDILIDGGKSEVGLESTVLDVTSDTPVILRPGMITYEMIQEVVPSVQMNQEVLGEQTPKSPGMKYKHYAPKALLTIVEGNKDDVVAYINQQTKQHHLENQRVGVIVTDDVKHRFIAKHQFVIGRLDQDAEIASNLFAALREMDTLDVDYIYSLSFHQGSYSEAIMNRLLKAANNRIIKVN